MIDYDYIIETFYVEYKIDKDAIKRLRAEYLNAKESRRAQIFKEFKELYPEHIGDDIFTPVQLPDTVSKKMYFVQNRKNDKNEQITSYSLKNKMLADLRSARNVAKKEMAKAHEDGRKLDEARYNSNQLALKIIQNSEYGACGNKYFAHYDPDIGGCTTYSARQLISFVTNQLEYDKMYVDDEFIKLNSDKIKLLKDCDAIKIDDIEFSQDDFINNRRHVLARFFEPDYRIKKKYLKKDKVQCKVITIPPSKVIYQDTDSNYYFNPYIIEKLTGIKVLSDGGGDVHISPEICDHVMRTMKAHNDLYASFVLYAVDRPPTCVNFESALIVARYFEAKKKYYGLYWDADKIMGTKLPDENAYEKDGTLIKHYNPYWKPKLTYLPMENGEYVKLNPKELLKAGANYLDYIKGQNIKPTGIDLTRRDQFPIINFFNVKVIQKDIKLMKYIYPNKWEYIPPENIKQVIIDVVKEFQENLSKYNQLAGFKYVDCEKYEIYNFSKDAAYRDDKLNFISNIVKRLNQETEKDRKNIEILESMIENDVLSKGEYNFNSTDEIQAEIKRINKESKIKLIPKVNERVSYCITIDSETQINRASMIKKESKTSERAMLVSELIDYIHNLLPKDKFNKDIIKTLPEYKDLIIDDEFWENVGYNKWVTAKAISLLDHKYYTEALCSNLSLYLVDGNGLTNDDKIKMRSSLTNELMNNFYQPNKNIGLGVKRINKEINKTICPDVVKSIQDKYKDKNYSEEYIMKHKSVFIDRAKNSNKKIINILQELYKIIEVKYSTCKGAIEYYSENQLLMNLYTNGEYDDIMTKIKTLEYEKKINDNIIENLGK